MSSDGMTNTTNDTPTYVYKLISSTATPPSPLPSKLPVSSLDQNDDFIHLSTSRQVARTLKRYFKDEPHAYILRIPYELIKKDVKWEDPRGQAPGVIGAEDVFPHLYNGLKVGKDEIESVQRWENKKDGEGWDAALRKAEGWLVY
ncbi:hypothetical protein QCA50_005039 [Cerrena zonata]|uniref:Uncharacterized protein n=1 Tax=Cerrena zonata TaxID=2478898 RepID=A0AAW0GKL4_9APHY